MLFSLLSLSNLSMAPMLFKFIALPLSLALVFSNTIGDSVLLSTSSSAAPATTFGNEAGLSSSPSPTLNPTPVITPPLTTNPSPVVSSRPKTGLFPIPQPLQGQSRLAPAAASYSLREPWSRDNLAGAWRVQPMIRRQVWRISTIAKDGMRQGSRTVFITPCPWLQGSPQSGSGATVCSAR